VDTVVLLHEGDLNPSIPKNACTEVSAAFATDPVKMESLARCQGVGVQARKYAAIGENRLQLSQAGGTIGSGSIEVEGTAACATQQT